LDFEVGILTNVTHDHLDYHPNLEYYQSAKAEFVASLRSGDRRKPEGVLVYWRDDPVAKKIGDAYEGQKISAGLSVECDVYATDVQATLDSTQFDLHMPGGKTITIDMKLLGVFSAGNATLAAAAAMTLGLDAHDVKKGLEAMSGVPGRFEPFGGSGKPTVIIDYCHTADAMERVLSACRGLGPRRLVTIFGCGGDRDRTKRPDMGRVAQSMSDACYITIDNPRGEPLRQINDDILSGMNMPDESVVIQDDRSGAVQAAIAAASGEDVIAVLGKGHESYQIVGDEKLPYSDKVEVEGALEKWSAR
jgi:UDP-N-acetylmuramoyl-L-alanyl-D-glutamate--2,6-diaminopimelate ligase